MDLKLLAQTSIPLPNLEGLGPLGQEMPGGGFDYFNTIWEATGFFEKVISVAIGVMTVIAGIWFIFGIVSAALQWLMGGGNKESIQGAQKKLINSIIGLVLVVTAYGLILAIGNVIGLGKILNPEDIIINVLHP